MDRAERLFRYKAGEVNGRSKKVQASEVDNGAVRFQTLGVAGTIGPGNTAELTIFIAPVVKMVKS